MGVVTVRALLSHAECTACMAYPTPPDCATCHNTRHEAAVLMVIEDPLPKVWGLSGVGKVIRKWGPGPDTSKAIEIEQFIQELAARSIEDEAEWAALSQKMEENRQMLLDTLLRYQRLNPKIRIQHPASGAVLVLGPTGAMWKQPLPSPAEPTVDLLSRQPPRRWRRR